MALISFDEDKNKDDDPMVASTHQLRKYFKTRWLQPNM
jgi:hypothetical protein